MDITVKLFFGFLLTFGLLIIAIWMSAIPENATGFTDADYKTLLHSGQTVASTSATKWLSYFFGIGIIGIFGFVLFMGGRKKEATIRKQIYRVLALGLTLYFLVYSAMVNSWWNYVETNSMEYFMGLPKPTAWMVFGMLLTPIFISYFYITKFEDWIYTKTDEQHFAEIIANRQKKEQ